MVGPVLPSRLHGSVDATDQRWGISAPRDFFAQPWNLRVEQVVEPVTLSVLLPPYEAQHGP